MAEAEHARMRTVRPRLTQNVSGFEFGLFRLLVLMMMGAWGHCGAAGLAGAPGAGVAAAAKKLNATVEYDHRSLLIDGRRRFLISGSIHYPRSTPKMWADLIQLAKEGGLDVIQTYVFWDGHEPRRGKYYFKRRYDLVRFVKAVHHAGLYVCLRIGPYVSAEWNFGGIPEWLREIKGMKFRTDNEPFKEEMEKFMSYVVEKMKKHKLFYNQGGPIILSQVENEYGMIESAFGDAGARYVEWAEKMATKLDIGVPWIMCKQPDAPSPIIDTCNGFYCDDYTPNAYDKPKMWTENWSGWFHYWGGPLPHRPVEDLAFATARFFQKGGSFVNYYMYHGGTNFGRTAAAGFTTSYDYDAPIDEYGQIRQPKWGHLKDLHAAIKLCEPALAAVDVEPNYWTIPGMEVEIRVYSTDREVTAGYSPRTSLQDEGDLCAAFLANTGLSDVTVDFLGQSYELPAWSVSILPDCKTVVFNTAKASRLTSQSRILSRTPKELFQSNLPVNESLPKNGVEAEVTDHSHKNHSIATASKLRTSTWHFARDVVGVWGEGITHDGLLEQINTTHDITDYLWYSTTVDIPEESNSSVVETNAVDDVASLTIDTVRDLVHVFVNGKKPGFHSAYNGSTFVQPLTLQPGNNSIAILSAIVGLWYAGPFYEKEVGGISGAVMLQGVPNVGDINLTEFQWIHQVGLKGEKLQRSPDYEVGTKRQNWSLGSPPLNEPLVWYKTKLISPEGDNPVVLDMGSMGKGEAWMNGHHLGRYWPAMHNPQDACGTECDYRGTFKQDSKCFSNCGRPSQRWYHVPREWLKSTGNLLVVFEEIGGNITGVSLSIVLHLLCAHVPGSHRESFKDGPKPASRQDPQLHLDCGSGRFIENVAFASFGTPSGRCGRFSRGDCHAPRSLAVVQEVCEGRQFCHLPVHRTVAGEDPCPNVEKSFAVEVVCGFSSR